MPIERRHRRILILACLAILLPTLTARATPDDAAAAPKAFPAVVELGLQPSGIIVRESIWLLNSTPIPLRVLGAKGNCGCTTVERFEPTTLAPNEVLEVPVTMEVPTTIGKRITKSFWFTFDGVDPLGVPITVESSDERNLREKLVAEDPSMSPLRAVPAVIDVGAVPAGESRSFEVLLINPTDAPLDVVRAKPFCECITAALTPTTIAPRRSTAVQISIDAPKEVGRSKSSGIAFVLREGRPLRLPMRVEARHPLVARAFDYFDAHDAGDEIGAAALLVEGAVTWNGERRGPGTPITSTIFGPWSGWNWELRREVKREDFKADGNTITGTLVEKTDLDRLLERPPRRRSVTVQFDESGRIAWIQYVRVPGGPDAGGRFNEFLEWARSNEPTELAEIFAGNKVTPSREHAWRWRELLLAWRRAAGLPPVALR